ncbi:MAG: cytochrome c oxidase assembly protein [Jatrophihabitans sp.]|nr:MAG: cytochrome c oxidase assembly protein [Jatrophihabitans sp.]
MDRVQAPSLSGLITQWTWQPVAIAAALVLGGWYWRGVRTLGRRGVPWTPWRPVAFGLALAVWVWSSCGFLEVYAGSLYWIWTTQVLTVWILVPTVLLAARPLQLAVTLGGPQGRISRFLGGRFVRAFHNPLLGPALVPVAAAGLFFGPLPRWTVQWPAAGWGLQLVLVAFGALILLPLLGFETHATSLAMGLSIAIASVELILDAIPGIVLRLHTQAATSYFAVRGSHAWSPDMIHDQRLAAAILWAVAEFTDVPFLLMLFRRWLRADAREAAVMDAVLEAEYVARRALREDTDEEPAGDVPWWVSDPQLRRRFHPEDR